MLALQYFIFGFVACFILICIIVWRFVVRESQEQMESHRRNRNHNWSNP
jgi:preprotein translocase subunit YajC